MLHYSPAAASLFCNSSIHLLLRFWRSPFHDDSADTSAANVSSQSTKQTKGLHVALRQNKVAYACWRYRFPSLICKQHKQLGTRGLQCIVPLSYARGHLRTHLVPILSKKVPHAPFTRPKLSFSTCLTKTAQKGVHLPSSRRTIPLG
jgi:hypothetical protein